MKDFEMYREAIAMALNIDPDKITKAKWDAQKDIWMVIVLDEGLVHFNLEGLLVRLCFKWINKTGRRAWLNTLPSGRIPDSSRHSPILTGTRTYGSMKDKT